MKISLMIHCLFLMNLISLNKHHILKFTRSHFSSYFGCKMIFTKHSAVSWNQEGYVHAWNCQRNHTFGSSTVIYTVKIALSGCFTSSFTFNDQCQSNILKVQSKIESVEFFTLRFGGKFKI